MKRLIQKSKSRRVIVISIILGLILMLGSAFAQQTKTMKIKGGGEILMLEEIGGIITETDDGIAVEMVLPPEHRAEQYKSTDIKQGDILKMVNGKSLKSIEQLKEIYSGLKIGDEIKFGIRRDKQMKMETLIKVDPADLPGKMMVMTGPAGGDDGVMALLEIGILLDEKDGKIIISDVIAEIADQFLKTKPEDGDILLKIQGKTLTSIDEVTGIFAGIKDGEKVELVYSHEGKELSTTFKKQKGEECGGKKMMIKKN